MNASQKKCTLLPRWQLIIRQVLTMGACLVATSVIHAASSTSKLVASSPAAPATAASSGEMMLWYNQAAKEWEEALPVGNGRLGAMVFGGVSEERIQLNEGTIWSGSPKEYNRVGAHKFLPEIRQLIYDGKYKEADELAKKQVLGERPEGAYHPLGDLFLKFDNVPNAKDYRRDLNLDTAIARVSYRSGDVVYTREVFSSVPDQVIVVRLTCDQPGQLSFSAQLTREADAESASVGSGLVLRGQADRGKPSAGTHFIARLEAVAEGGAVTSKDGVLRVEKANAVTLLINAASDYRSKDYEAQCEKLLAAASTHSFADLRDAHIKEHQRLFRRVALNLGKASDLPTDERLRRFKDGEQDNALMALFFQFGRYMLISSSRPGNLPANLQGIWNKVYVNQPWFCGWHFDISAPMNYWLAETANLSECHTPFLDFIDAIRVNGRKTAQEVYGCSGFVVAHRTTPWLFTSPVNGLNIWASGVGWICQHLWEHYQFTQDREYLRNKAYPIMKEAAEFYLSWLTPHPETGKLVSGPSISAENSFLVDPKNPKIFAELDMGPAQDQQTIAELFDNCLAGAAVLGIQDEFTAKVKEARSQLADGHQIGSDGRLLEWSIERPEREPGHRHLGHLYSTYPGAQISPRQTPELAEAVRKSLEVRLQHGNTRAGGLGADSGNTGWSLAWTANLWARLGDGEKAYQAIRRMIADLVFPNLMCTAPRQTTLVFQIDGQLGMPAAMIEMLMQSHAGEIELLPALPKEWANGSVKGLRARGVYEVDLIWESGQLKQAKIQSLRGGICKVRLGERTAEFETAPGEVVMLDTTLMRITP